MGSFWLHDEVKKEAPRRPRKGADDEALRGSGHPDKKYPAPKGRNAVEAIHGRRSKSDFNNLDMAEIFIKPELKRKLFFILYFRSDGSNGAPKGLCSELGNTAYAILAEN